MAESRIMLGRAILPERTRMNEHARRARQVAALAAGLMLGGAVAAKAQPTSVPELDCVIEPQQVVKLATPVVGVIARIDVDRGDVVHKGQVLGKLEDGLEQATLNLSRVRATNEYGTKAIQARLDFLRRKNARTGELMAKNIATQAAADEAGSDANVAEQQLKEAELNLELARLQVGHDEEALKQRMLISPIDGVVTERLLVPGEYRNEQSPIVTLAQIDPLRVEVFVPTSQYGRIRIGSSARIHPQQPIGGILSGDRDRGGSGAGCGERYLRGAAGAAKSRLAAAGRHSLQGPVRSAGCHHRAAAHVHAGDDGSEIVPTNLILTGRAFRAARLAGWMRARTMIGGAGGFFGEGLAGSPELRAGQWLPCPPEHRLDYDPVSLKMRSCLGWSRDALAREVAFPTDRAARSDGRAGEFFWVFPPTGVRSA